jgi:hypothetical protein
VLAQEVLDFGDGLGTIAADILQIDLKRGIVSDAFPVGVIEKEGTHPQEVEIGQVAVARFGATQTHDDDTDQGGESKDIRREDTRDATGFTHGGGGELRVIVRVGGKMRKGESDEVMK